MTITRKRFIGGVLTLAIIGGGTVAEVTEMSGANAATVYTTSKIAYNTPNLNYSKTPKFKMISSSVLNNGANSTIVMKFDKNITSNMLKSYEKQSLPNDLYVTVVKQKSQNNYESLSIDLAKGFYSHYDSQKPKSTYPTTKTNIRYVGNTISIDFSKKDCSIELKDDFQANLTIVTEDNIKAQGVYETQTKTNGYTLRSIIGD